MWGKVRSGSSSPWQQHRYLSYNSLMVLFHTIPSRYPGVLPSLFISRNHTSAWMLMDRGGWARPDLFLCCSFYTDVYPFALEPTLRLPFPKGTLNLAAGANYLWKDSHLHCHQFQGHFRFSLPICSPRAGRKDRRFGETTKKGGLTCTRTLSFTTPDVSAFIPFNRSDKCHLDPSGHSHVVTSDL